MAQILMGEQSLAVVSICGYCGLRTDCTRYEERNGQEVAVMDFRAAPDPDCPRCGAPMDPDKVTDFANKMAKKDENMFGPNVGVRVEVPTRRRVEDE